MRTSALLALLYVVGGSSQLPCQTIRTLTGLAGVPSIAAVEQHNPKCVDQGKQRDTTTLDSLTNLLKNRIDQASEYHVTTISTLLTLPFKSSADPSVDMPRSRVQWKEPDATRTGRYDSRPIAVDGYIIAVGREGTESSNCQIADTAWYDYHMWLVRTEKEAHDTNKTKALVVEITPRVRHGHAADFNIKQMQQWAHDGVKVRVSGWLMLDPDHPDDTRPDKKGRPASRGTIWEIHPMMRIEKVP